VRGTHGVIIGGFTVSEYDPRRLSIVAVLDNLLKGAATQAVQNLNLAFGLEDLAGIATTGVNQT
jgi:N-acetyl-gamma-glutamylphosphate reductase